MDYQVLRSLFYRNKDEFQKLYETRFNGESTFHLPIDVAGYPSFYVVNEEMIEHLGKIYEYTLKLGETFKRLPKVALRQCINSNITDEIMVTNDIEGVRSTRSEIKEAMFPESYPSMKSRRFSGLSQKYVKLSSKDLIPLNTCMDLRNLYGEIVQPEIEKSDWPDGVIFRKESVSVKTATQKIRHKGISPETKLISYVENILYIMNHVYMPPIVKAGVIHYLLEYAHPFYDGNGRLGRFIASYMLCQSLHVLVATRISYTIKEQKSKYYKLFDICDDPRNRGDLTPFLLWFLEAVEESAKNIYEKITELADTLGYYRWILNEKVPKVVHDKKAVDLLYLLIQNKLFEDKGLAISELAYYLKVSSPTVRNKLVHLSNLGFPILSARESGRTLLYSIDLESFEMSIENIKNDQ